MQKVKTKHQKKSAFKKTIVFDLDETLVSAGGNEPINGYDFRIKVIENDMPDELYWIYVKFRPYLL